VDEKIADWLSAGVKLLWLVDPRRKSVTVYKLESEPVTLNESGAIAGEDVLPGKSMIVAELLDTD